MLYYNLIVFLIFCIISPLSNKENYELFKNIYALNCKSEDESLFTMNIFKNWFFIVSVVASIGIQILFMEIPSLSKLLELTTVSYKMLFVLILVSLIVFAACEIYKLVYSQIKKKSEKKMD